MPKTVSPGKIELEHGSFEANVVPTCSTPGMLTTARDSSRCRTGSSPPGESDSC